MRSKEWNGRAATPPPRAHHCGGPHEDVRFRRHLRRLDPLFGGLRRGGRDEPLPLAILAVESFNRPARQRLGEYLVWRALSGRSPRRVARLSVGIAQIQLRHWRDLGFLDDVDFSRRALRVVTSPEANYDACRAYLRERLDPTHATLSEVVRTYTGGCSRRYADLLRIAWEEFETG